MSGRQKEIGRTPAKGDAREAEERLNKVNVLQSTLRAAASHMIAVSLPHVNVRRLAKQRPQGGRQSTAVQRGKRLVVHMVPLVATRYSLDTAQKYVYSRWEHVQANIVTRLR